jgi:hypothetical protein
VQDALAGVEAADALETSGAPADLLAELALRGIFQRLSGMHPPRSFLSLLPSEAGGGIRGMVLFPGAQEGSPPTCRLQHPENPAPVFSRSLSSTRSGNRDLLSDLRRCAWQSLKLFLQEAVPEKNPIPGAVIAIQTFGDFLGFNPHRHVLVVEKYALENHCKEITPEIMGEQSNN